MLKENKKNAITFNRVTVLLYLARRFVYSIIIIWEGF